MPPHRYPELAALVGEDSDNLPGVPGVGPKTAAKWISTYDGLDNVIAHADEIKGKAGDSLREHLGDVIRNRQLNALVRDLPWRSRPTDLAKQPWDRQEVHTALRRPGVPGAARPALRDPGVRGGGRGGRASTSTRAGSVRASSPAGSPAHASPGERVGVQVQGTWRAGSGDVYAIALAASTRRPPGSTSSSSAPRTTRCWPAGWPTRRTPRCCTTPRARCWRSPRAAGRWPGLERDTALSAYLARPDQRSYDLADLTAALPQARAQGRGRRRRGPAQPSTASATTAPATPRCCRPGPCSTWPRRSTRSSSERGGTRLLADVELPLVDVLAEHGAHRRRGRRRRTSRRSRRTSPAR